ncbi:L-serine ammonia-lyase [Citromicrobium bathyomarinum]|uniref:L-serine ammonia-lyase n=1 Tax=Sphingomonadales TaxID=204457 RepID=UPI000C3A0EA0|nr:L-serine ammonia-lyase [Citromicrobium sp.]|tara:strand:+ start:9901 stop:11286 length:1386 start_codon:yes stop_codon:yes gene_type:complete
MLSVLDIFRIGIGPSSSHTVGPMRIARRFVRVLEKSGQLGKVVRVAVELQGSLALTGVGHGTVDASILGLAGFRPERTDPDEAARALAAIHADKRLSIGGRRDIAFDPQADIDLAGQIIPSLHPNGMVLRAFDAAGELLREGTYFSTGGGFVASEAQLKKPPKDDQVKAGATVPYPFGSAEEMLAQCAAQGLSVSDLMLANEDAMRPREETLAGLDAIAQAMDGCIDRGLSQRGVLPGGLKVQRRAPDLWDKLSANPQSNEREQLFDWLNCYAMAVNEENAAGGRVVTAPTNGAAGIIPAVIRFYCKTSDDSDCAQKRRHFLLTAGAIGLLYKQRASISGAEMGCQGEVGVACSMAAGGLAALWGASPVQVACAAEIGMEHNLGLTCDPVGGLVQVPCIERNAIGAVKAVNAARLALHRTGAESRVSLDQVIETMRQTGLDMSSKYKETSQGGLAVNVVEC